MGVTVDIYPTQIPAEEKGNLATDGGSTINEVHCGQSKEIR